MVSRTHHSTAASAPDGPRSAGVAGLLDAAAGRACAALAEMVGGKVRLSVTAVDFCDRGQAAERARRQGDGWALVAVQQHFTGPVWGEALLILPETAALHLVRAILGEAVPLDSMTELEHEALLEIGNVVLNACLGSIADGLGQRLEGSLPVGRHGGCEAILDTGPGAGGGDDQAMILDLDFDLGPARVGGMVAFVVDVVAAHSLRQLVAEAPP